MQIIRASTLKPSRWKNGGGETTEIATWPPGAALDAFTWRLSMAVVATDGPFSLFPDIDRTLTMLTGAVKLKFEHGGQPAVLTPSSAPFSFPGDVNVSAELWGGPARDFNVMTRRGAWRHQVTAHHRQPFQVAPDAGAFAAILLTHGTATISAANGAADLGALDTALLSVDDSPAAVELSPDALAYAVAITRA
jgi:uncharacterized protein